MSIRTITALFTVSAFLFFSASHDASAGTDGISRLIATTQMKSNNANEEAMVGANQQKNLIQQQKSLRASQTNLPTAKKTATSPYQGDRHNLLDVHGETLTDARYSPKSSPAQFMRANWLSNRVFKSFDAIVDRCCCAGNTLLDQPWKIMSIARRDWAPAGQSL